MIILINFIISINFSNYYKFICKNISKDKYS
jgi:hypothetical protein